MKIKALGWIVFGAALFIAGSALAQDEKLGFYPRLEPDEAPASDSGSNRRMLSPILQQAVAAGVSGDNGTAPVSFGGPGILVNTMINGGPPMIEGWVTIPGARISFQVFYVLGPQVPIWIVFNRSDGTKQSFSIPLSTFLPNGAHPPVSIEFPTTGTFSIGFGESQDVATAGFDLTTNQGAPVLGPTSTKPGFSDLLDTWLKRALVDLASTRPDILAVVAGSGALNAWWPYTSTFLLPSDFVDPFLVHDSPSVVISSLVTQEVPASAGGGISQLLLLGFKDPSTEVGSLTTVMAAEKPSVINSLAYAQTRQEMQDPTQPNSNAIVEATKLIDMGLKSLKDNHRFSAATTTAFSSRVAAANTLTGNCVTMPPAYRTLPNLYGVLDFIDGDPKSSGENSRYSFYQAYTIAGENVEFYPGICDATRLLSIVPNYGLSAVGEIFVTIGAYSSVNLPFSELTKDLAIRAVAYFVTNPISPVGNNIQIVDGQTANAEPTSFGATGTFAGLLNVLQTPLTNNGWKNMQIVTSIREDFAYEQP